MSNFREIYQQVLDAPYFTRLKVAKNDCEEIFKYLKRCDNSADSCEDKYKLMVLASLKPIIGADGVFSSDEFDFICDVFDVDFNYNKLLDFLNNISRKTELSFSDLLYVAPQNVKVAFVSLAISICAADGTITYEERREIEKYMF